jgi:4-oxalocrotonate tautomerase
MVAYTKLYSVHVIFCLFNFPSGAGTSIERRLKKREIYGKQIESEHGRNEPMPIITLEMGPLSNEQKDKLITAFTRDVYDVTGMPPEAMVVLIHELSRDNMGIGGHQVSKMNRR